MHRNDIDGLRTVAVLPVVASHFVILPNLFGGGFVGVDVFFVISGYLITSTLFSEVSDGTYSIAEFYNRRIRRIFPALFVVYAFCIAVVPDRRYPNISCRTPMASRSPGRIESRKSHHAGAVAVGS